MLQTASVMDNAAQQTEMCSKTCCTQFHLTTLLCMCQACHICKQGICQQWYTLFIKREVKVQYTTIDVTAAAWRNECSICFVVTQVPKSTVALGPLSSCILLADFHSPETVSLLALSNKLQPAQSPLIHLQSLWFSLRTLSLSCLGSIRCRLIIGNSTSDMPCWHTRMFCCAVQCRRGKLTVPQ